MHLILFDIDGTLFRGEGVGSLALKRAFEDVFGVAAVENQDLRAVPFNGRSDPAIVADMAAMLGIESDVFREASDRFREVYLERLREVVEVSNRKRLLPGASDLIPQLHDHSRVALGLLTGNIEAGARIKLGAFDFNRFFPFGGFGDDGVERPVLARRAHERGEAHHVRRFDTARVLVVGDTVHDVTAARTNGFAAVGVETGGVPAEAMLSAGAEAVFAGLDGAFPEWLMTRILS